MPPKFGTSGLRGLVTELTTDCVTRYITAFVQSCETGTGLFIAHDLRNSSPGLAETVAKAACDLGVDVTLCGPVPTPALALVAIEAGAAAVMVTGSHIPADRNGLKFYTPQGEISKVEETAILTALDQSPEPAKPGVIHRDDSAAQAYIARYTGAFGQALRGLRIGLYAHSAVGRDLMAQLLGDLGAEVMTLGHSDVFVPVDTEAVPADIRAQFIEWAGAYRCDAIVSTDGDGDRPMLADENGAIIPGDLMGQITAAALGARRVVTPISSNTGVFRSGFAQVLSTKIGSPFVIAGMAQLGGDVVGYEANGGFLLGFEGAGPTGPLPPLMTRDAVLPLIATLTASRGGGLAARAAAEPARFTAADRLQEVPVTRSQALVQRLTADTDARDQFVAGLGGVASDINTLDGLRMTLDDGRIIHLRPSGNAPELRLYVEAGTPEDAARTLKSGLAQMAKAVAV
ncbi:phosphomannomutase [Yoonia sp. BS5-3]|uniref:Phosphomannomutase n=1 Tax=Yoonia phaeophyticola TaxID=3137369 RepID=A0ABZ2V5Z9_9RHOB